MHPARVSDVRTDARPLAATCAGLSDLARSAHWRAERQAKTRAGVRALLLGLAMATAAVGLGLARPAAAQTAEVSMSVPLAADAPQEYIVKKGDTLWDIAGVFLSNPWYWPEIWQVNPAIENPHLIFPGDVLNLRYVNGKPQVTLGRAGAVRLSPQVRSAPLKDAIRTVPYDLLMDFVGRPKLLARDEIRNAPYVVGLRDGHLIGAEEHEIYGRRMPDAQLDARYTVVNVGEELRDPDDNAVLGYLGHFAGTAQVMRSGKLPKLRVTDSGREILQGDILMPATTDYGDDIEIRTPQDAAMDGQIIAVVDGVHVVGRYQVVAINRGSRDGLVPGNPVAIFEIGDEIRDRFDRAASWRRVSTRYERVQLPKERSGIVLLFRVFDRMSYGLVIESTHAMRVGDYVRHPDHVGGDAEALASR